jgi:2-iminobutanoate/2-iminopropanoate deaminase
MGVNQPQRIPGQFETFAGASIHAGLIYTSGVVDRDALRAANRSAEEQAGTALRELLTIIERAGGTAFSVLRVEAFIASPEVFAAWDAEFARLWPQTPPARTTVVARLAVPSLRIEVQAIAAQDQGFCLQNN